MNQSIILIACFLPLGIIYIVMKFAVWMSAVNAEKDYVGQEFLRKRGPYVADAYAAVDEEEDEYGDRTDFK